MSIQSCLDFDQFEIHYSIHINHTIIPIQAISNDVMRIYLYFISLFLIHFISLCLSFVPTFSTFPKLVTKPHLLYLIIIHSFASFFFVIYLFACQYFFQPFYYYLIERYFIYLSYVIDFKQLI